MPGEPQAKKAKNAASAGPPSATPCLRCTAPLTEEREHLPNLVCDGGCGRTFRPGQLRLACLGCDFDLCARCSRSGQGKKRPRDAEAAAAVAAAVAAVYGSSGSSTPAAGEPSSSSSSSSLAAKARSSAAPGSATATQKLNKSRGRTALPQDA